ncbi:MAG: MATE family efflux transporter, partial [Clostridia bacterium]|nr:MATE family efflux transporter [Clostridia bacterium]
MKQVDMLSGPIGKSVITFSIPVFLTYLIQLMYHTTDTLIVGRFLGTDPQAAVGAGGNLITLMIGLLGGITVGVSVLVARYFGAGDREGMKRLTTAALLLAVLLSV